MIDRLNEINIYLNQPTTLESLTLINTFLIVNLEEFRKGRRSASILNSSRYSSTAMATNIDECCNNIGGERLPLGIWYLRISKLDNVTII